MISDAFALFSGSECESPIEQALEHHLTKFLAGHVSVERQVPCTTLWGAFRFDFVLSANGLRIALECDGAEYHDQEHDEWRDAVTLGSGIVDEVVRFAGHSIHHCPDDCLFVLSCMHPRMFSSRTRNHLDRLAFSGDERVDVRQELVLYGIPVTDAESDEIVAEHTVAVRRRRRAERPQYWENLYQVAQRLGPSTLREVIARDKAAWCR